MLQNLTHLRMGGEVRPTRSCNSAPLVLLKPPPPLAECAHRTQTYFFLILISWTVEVCPFHLFYYIVGRDLRLGAHNQRNFLGGEALCDTSAVFRIYSLTLIILLLPKLIKNKLP